MDEDFREVHAELEVDSFDKKEVNSLASLYANFTGKPDTVETGDSYREWYERLRDPRLRESFREGSALERDVLFDENILHILAANEQVQTNGSVDPTDPNGLAHLGFLDYQFPDIKVNEGDSSYSVVDDALTCLLIFDELAETDREVYFPENFYDGNNIQKRLAYNEVPEGYATGLISNLKKIENFQPTTIGYNKEDANPEDSYIADKAYERDCVIVTHDTDFLDEEEILSVTPVQMRGLVSS
jgi:hypothetical protein